MRNLIISFCLICPLSIFAQTQATIESIVAGNKSLKSLSAEIKALQNENKIGLTLANPEIEFAYLWGAPSNIGARKDLGISQEFDLATLTGARRRLAKEEDKSLASQYAAEKMEIVLEARNTIVEIISANQRIEILTKRLECSKLLSETYSKMVNEGKATILELNKAKLNHAKLSSSLSREKTERTSLIRNLERLSGGNSFEINQTSFDTSMPKQSFDQWYATIVEQHPLLLQAEADLSLSKQKISMAKSERLPSIKAGYTSEIMKEEKFRGVSLSLSIPLWGNKRKIGAAKAMLEASQTRLEDTKEKIRLGLQSIYERTLALEQETKMLNEARTKYSDLSILQKSLEAGKISLSQYLVEETFVYDAEDSYLSSVQEFQLSLAKLKAAE